MPRSRGDVAGRSNHNWTTRRCNHYRRRGSDYHRRRGRNDHYGARGSDYHRRRGRRNHYRSRCNDAFDQMYDSGSKT